MKLIIDTNRIIAALIKKGASRRIIFNRDFEFITPEHSIGEIYKYEDEIRKKANISHEEFEILLSLIFENIKIISKENYHDFLEIAKTLISDIDDVPFIAACFATKANGIWSDDSHFFEQNKIKVFRTFEMIKLIEKNNNHGDWPDLKRKPDAVDIVLDIIKIMIVAIIGFILIKALMSLG